MGTKFQFTIMMKTATTLLVAALIGTASAKSVPSTLVDSMNKNSAALLTATNCGGTTTEEYTKAASKCAADYLSACLKDFATCAKARDSAGKSDCSAAAYVQTYADCTKKALCAHAGSNADCLKAADTVLKSTFGESCKVGTCPRPFPIVIIIVVVVVLLLAAVALCYCKKWCCFKAAAADQK